MDITISYYATGTATVVGKNVTGQGTAWSSVRKGDLYGTHLGTGVRIAEVIDDNHLTLAYDVPALYQTAAAYEIQRTPYDLGYMQAIQSLLGVLGSGNLESLAALDGSGGDKLVALTGPETAEAISAKLLLAINALDGSGGDKGILLNGNDGASTYELTAFARSLMAKNDGEQFIDELGIYQPPEKSYRQVATRTRMCLNWTNGGNTRISSRTRHFMRDSVAGLKLVFGNFWLNAGSEIGAGGQMAVSASIEYPVGAFTQVRWGGATSVSIDQLALAVSDLTDVAIPDGAEFFVRSFQNCPAGIIYTGNVDTANGERAEYSTNGTDKTMGGVIVDGGAGACFPPVAILGFSDRPAVAVFGDSRTEGSGDVKNDLTGDWGNVGRWLSPTHATMILAKGGDRAQYLLASGTCRRALLAYATHGIVELGINDVLNGRTAAQLQSDVEAIIGWFADKPVFPCTLEPASSSSDGWTTVVGQTTHSGNPARVAYNNAVRAGIPGAAGFLEIADAVESSRNSGKWKVPGYVSDGLHETPLGYAGIRDSGFPDASKIFVRNAVAARFAKEASAKSGLASNEIMSPLSTRQLVEGRRAVFAASPNGIQVIPAAVWTKIPLASEVVDLGGYFDPATSRWTPPAGPVRLSLQVYLREKNNGSVHQASIYKNGSVIANSTLTANNSGEDSLFVVTADTANGSDFYEAFVFVGGSATRPIDGFGRTIFSGQRV